MDAYWTRLAVNRPKVTTESALAELIPASLAEALLDHLELDADLTLAALPRESRRGLSHALTGFALDVTGSRGYNYAEATAGGVALDEIDPSSMESRKCPGLFLVGEMLDVDGRLGGFNFQWAWSSGRAAAEGLARKFAGT
jgi:predicted flavoprotein YhiN